MISLSIVFYIGSILVVYDNFKMNRKVIAICCALLYLLIALEQRLNVHVPLCIAMSIYLLARSFLAFRYRTSNYKEVDNEEKDINISTINSNKQ